MTSNCSSTRPSTTSRLLGEPYFSHAYCGRIKYRRCIGGLPRNGFIGQSSKQGRLLGIGRKPYYVKSRDRNPPESIRYVVDPEGVMQTGNSDVVGTEGVGCGG